MNWEEVERKIVHWLRSKVEEAGANGLVQGISGGLDSSITAVLVKKAVGNNHLGLILPCHSSPKDIEHANLLAQTFALRTEVVDLTPVYDLLLTILPPGTPMAKANLKPRLRMLTLYYYANTFNYLVVGTGNKSELQVGYFTKYGDGGVDLLPLGSLYKTQLRGFAYYLGIPREIIEKAPSAGLWEGQTDEGEMGITYSELDSILEALERGEYDASSPLVLKVEKMVKSTAHKRALPPICPL